MGLFIFFGFGLLFSRSERSRLGNCWVCSNFLNLVCCFCGVSEASEAYSETFGFVRILGLFVFFWIWVCLGCCFCGVSEVS